MAQRHDRAAGDHGLAPTEEAIRDEAADDRREVREGGVAAVDPGRAFLRDRERLGHVVDEQRAHAEVGELLPHLGQKQDRQAARVSEPVNAR